MIIHLPEFPEHLKNIKPEIWEQFFALIPELEKMNNYCDVVVLPNRGMPYNIMVGAVETLHTMLLDNGLFPFFDYYQWENGVEILHKKNFAEQDAITICKLFTIMVRRERFCDGTVAKWCEEGIVQQMMKRLKVLNSL